MIDRLAEARPASGRPLVDSIGTPRSGTSKSCGPARPGEARCGSCSAFDPWRSAILLTGGDKSGDWQGWYRRAIPRAEELYEEYLKEREAEEAR